jgi:hypothetical protein
MIANEGLHVRAYTLVLSNNSKSRLNKPGSMIIIFREELLSSLMHIMSPMLRKNINRDLPLNIQGDKLNACPQISLIFCEDENMNFLSFCEDLPLPCPGNDGNSLPGSSSNIYQFYQENESNLFLE